MLTLEGFNILNMKSIHSNGRLYTLYRRRVASTILLKNAPSTPTKGAYRTAANTFSGEYGSPQTIWRLQRMLDAIVIIAFYTQTGSTRRVFCTAKVLVPKYIPTFYCRFSVSVFCHELIKADIRQRQQRMIGFIVIH